MLVIEEINRDLASSMKEGDTARTNVLRLLKNALQNEQIKTGQVLLRPQELKVIQREAKQRKDSIAQYREGKRDDLADAEQEELTIIETYLPQQMSEAELNQLIDGVLAETQATPVQIGVVIGKVMQQAAGRADGAAVSELVRQKLAQ